jgi:hypothetical protein
MRPVLYAAYQMCVRVRAFGSAPAFSSASSSSRYDACCWAPAVGCGYHVRNAHSLLSVAKQRRHAIVVAEIRVGAAREKAQRQIVLAVDDRHDHRCRSVAVGRDVHVQTAVEEGAPRRRTRRAPRNATP